MTIPYKLISFSEALELPELKEFGITYTQLLKSKKLNEFKTVGMETTKQWVISGLLDYGRIALWCTCPSCPNELSAQEYLDWEQSGKDAYLCNIHLNNA